MNGFGVDMVWVDEYTKADAQTFNNLKGNKMALTNQQFVEMGRAAMQAIIACNDSIILTPEGVAERAWDMAEAMGKVFDARNSTPNVNAKTTHVGSVLAGAAEPVISAGASRHRG